MIFIRKKFIPRVIIHNYKKIKGFGAGGKNTINGKRFENDTNNLQYLMKESFEEYKDNSKYTYYIKKYKDKKIIYTSQYGFKKYMKKYYNIDICRCPDEAYIIEFYSGKKEIKILEKKEQRVNGSVDIKLWAGPSLKREYELITNNRFEISYGFCVNRFLWEKINSIDKKYITLDTIFKENNIKCLFGECDNYFENLHNWIHS